MNVISRFINYINSSRHELKKVVWPSKKEITQHTLLVIFISLGVAAFLGVADYVLNILIETIIQ